MAEVLGLVASGISVAQFAASILKVKALLDEVKDAPESLSNMLDHIELLAPILCEATTGGDEGAGTNLVTLPVTSHLQQAVQKALIACKAAGEQLELLARSLMSQIDAARGGVRRKHAVVKVVLKKGTLAQYETRLQKTIQLLALAQSTYIIALQRAQPEAIVSQLMTALIQSSRSAQRPTMIPCQPSLPQIHSPHTETGRRISSHQNASALQECWQWGLAKLTGLVRIHTSSRTKENTTETLTQDRVLRIQVQMPKWLCASVLDAVFSRSYAGWDCSLNMYGRLKYGSTEFSLVTDAIRNDDLGAMNRLFQERRCGPLDLLTGDEDEDESLLSYALNIGALQASRYLLNYGATQPDEMLQFGFLGYDSERSKSYVAALLKHELNDAVRISCLLSCWDDLNSFTDLVGQIWPNDEFYTAAFEDERLNLATWLPASLKEAWCSPSPAVFQHLCGSSSLAQAGSSTTVKVLTCITWGLGNIIWYDQDVTSKWYSAIRDTALRLDKSLVMPEQQLLEYEMVGLPRYQRFPKPTPFTALFQGSMLLIGGYNKYPRPGRFKSHKIAYRLASCDRAVRMWLNILQDMGINLVEYGRQERQRLKDEDSGYEFEIWRNVYHEWWSCMDPKNGLLEIRLIGFEYGKEPGDWKLWWSEPTDGLVGDFWKEMEPEPLCIPGSWDEDF